MNLGSLGLVLALMSFCNCYLGNDNVTSETSGPEDLSGTVLSRRKRFIIFPDGSSFQLVFCTQNHGYLQIGDIVWFANTAALAWELPSDPAIYYAFRDKSKIYQGNRRADKNIYYLNEDGRVIGKTPYHRRPIVNPAFAKRSIEPVSIEKMHNMQKSTNYLNDLHEKSIEFHRSGRMSFYSKLERVLQALGWNGTECVLRMLCESGQEKGEQGTFVEEIVRATFTLPKGRGSEEQYDAAHGSSDCETAYPGCDGLHAGNYYERSKENV